MGVCVQLAWAWLAIVVAAVVVVVVVEGSSVPKRGINEIKAFVKRLEYEARGGAGGRYKVGGLGDAGDEVVVNLNLLPDDVIVRDIETGLDEEFALVDEEQGDKEETKKNSTDRAAESRQLSLIYQGVYLPDARFNAFADGVMVNMVAEMRRKEMDPLYFRVYNRGIIEHVPLSGRGSSTTSSPSSSFSSTTSSSSSSSSSSTSTSRRGRQRGEPIGGGVIRGLSNVKRFGNAEIQVAGNTTLVRSHYVFGPLNLELLFTTEMGVRAVNSTLGALAAHSVTHLNDTSPSFIDLIIDSPASYEIQLVGTRSERYMRLSRSAMSRLFKPTGRLERRLKGAYTRARRRRIPDVTKRRSGSRRRGGRGRNGEKVTTEASVTPELP